MSLLNNNIYIDDMFRCEKSRLKNLNQEIYKRFIKPFYIPLIALLSCFLLTFSKVQNNFTLKSTKVFLYVFLVLIISETLMRYAEESKIQFISIMTVPFFLFILIYNFLMIKVK